jgi:release factor glutamine methyltransferase
VAPEPTRRALVSSAAEQLRRGGVASPEYDAAELLAHVLGVSRGALALVDRVAEEQAEAYRALVARRAAREPLQHLTGSAFFRHVELAVGPGVFVPRPETELLLGEAVAAVRGIGEPRIVDLCTGSGALALAIATTRPDAEVHAVELDADALGWARRNLEGSGVRLTAADVTDGATLATLEGIVDLVVANPPYVPEGTEVPPEVDHDPHDAVFAGPDGLAVIGPLSTTAARLLRHGGRVALEHDESHADRVRELLGGAGFADVETRVDLTGRARMTVGTRRRD